MKLLVFGATGLAGSGVLRACLDAPEVSEVRVVVRRSTGVSDPKLREFIHDNYLEYVPIADAFSGVDACFFCLGVSVSKAPVEADYRRIHQAYPIAAATMLRATSPAAPFQYLSGKSTDLNSRWMWARVKAEAERDLIAAFAANCFRPGMIDGTGPSSQAAIVDALRPVLRADLQAVSQPVYRERRHRPRDAAGDQTEAARSHPRERRDPRSCWSLIPDP